MDVSRRVLTPISLLTIEGELIGQRLADYTVTKSCTQPGGSCNVVLADKGASLAVEPGDKLTLALGYAGEWQATTVFTGWIQEVRRRPRFEIRALDDYYLQLQKISVSLRRMTPAKVVADLLERVQPELEISALALPSQRLRHFQGKQRCVKDLLRDLRSTLIKRKWPIDGTRYAETVYPFWRIDCEGNFSWAPWADVTAMPFRFEYAKNISEFDPAEASVAEQGLLRLVSFPHPWVHAGDTVIVDHPRLGAPTRLRVDTHTISKSGTDRTRSVLFLSRLLEAA